MEVTDPLVTGRRMLLFVGTDTWTAQVARDIARALGLAMARASSGASALRAAATWRPAVVLMEDPLPDEDGPALCERLRNTVAAAITVLMDRDDAGARIQFLERGADDCLVRPFDARQLIARQRAFLRRWAEAQSLPQTGGEMKDRYAIGDVRIEPATRAVRVGDRSVALREREFRLLLELVREPGRVITRHELLRRVWGYADTSRGGTLDVHMHRLRHKLAAGDEGPHFIETVKGIGYRVGS